MNPGDYTDHDGAPSHAESPKGDHPDDENEHDLETANDPNVSAPGRDPNEPHDEVRLADAEHGALSLPDQSQAHGESRPGGHTDEAEHASEGDHGGHHYGPAPNIPIWLLLPFAALLGSIALMPFINAHVWHDHFPDFAFFLGAVVVAYYLLGFNEPDYAHGQTYGQYQMMHALLEYYAFIALVGGLYVVSGGVLVDVKTSGGPVANTVLLAFGAVIANVVGTTGASMLLIRPFMRINQGRLRPIHIVMFIFIVSNCGGCLTPIGDPPLYLGFLKGVPFFWTLEHLWLNWAVVVGLLLAMYFVIDSRIPSAAPAEPVALDKVKSTGFPVRISGAVGIFCLGLMILGVFIDPMLKSAGVTALEGVPVGATFQIAVATAAYFLAPKHIHEANEFNFFPVKEVGLLFCGIFATMAPALGYLSTHGEGLKSVGLDGPTGFYFGTGSLSGVLDNAPTYLNFLQISFAPSAVNAETVQQFVADPAGVSILAAISTGAVFFGAMTYIGNGPNFMVKAIAETSGVRMPSFFGYLARACVLLLPLLVLHWLIFFVL
jgi:Na+/H+ antiporter NhaD/arsenite permease-like protein